jgi:lipase
MPIQHSVAVNGVSIAVWEWPGENPAVFFCHGTGMHGCAWDQVIAHLPGRRCFAIDARGHGRSSKPAPPYLWRNFGADVAAIARWLGLAEAVGVGHSMGGHAVTLGSALEPRAFSALLLLDPVIRPKDGYIGPSQHASFVAKRRNRWASWREMFERFKDRPPFDTWDRAVLGDYCEYGVLPDGDSFVLACPPEIEASVYENSPARESNIYPEIATIQIPVEVVRAGRHRDPGDIMRASPTAPDAASSFARGRDLCLPNHSHFIPQEAPALTAQWITEILAGRLATGDGLR